MKMTMFSFGYSNGFNQKEHYILPFKNDFKEIAKQKEKLKKSAAVRNSMYISFSIIQFSLKTTTMN